MTEPFICFSLPIDGRQGNQFAANLKTPSETMSSSNIVKLLTEGTPIICDRYAFSGIAFSASKVSSDGSPLLPFEWCRGPDIGLPAPDLVIFFDISSEKAKERGGYGEERYEKEEMQARVRHAFHQLGEEMQSASGGTRWISLDAGRNKEEVEADVWALVEPLVQEGMPTTISRLWMEPKVGTNGQSMP
jgi:dTMP kinase